MAGVDFKAVRSRVTLAQVLELLGFVPSESQGDQVRGRCPIHDAASPHSRTFSAHLGKNTYRCFKCGSAGNQLDLWAAATHQPLYEATVDICERLDIAVPWLR